MASPAFRSIGGPGTGTGTGFTATEPTGATTDDIILLAILIQDTHSGFTPPSGWTEIGTQDFGAATGRLYGIRRGASAPAYNVSWTTSQYYEWSTYAISGAITSGAIYEAITQATPDTSISAPDCPSVTALTADTLIFLIGWHWAGFGSGTTAPSGYTIRFNGSGGYDHCVATKALAAAGAEDPAAFSGGVTASDNRSGWTVVIPSVAAGGPTISAQPSDAHVHVGATASFSVTAAASGGGTLSYQWKKNGSNVVGGSGGTTASYTTPTLTQADDGALYTCDVTETGGSSDGTTSSASATLRVGVIYIAAGTIAYSASGGTSVAPGYPTGVAAGDLLVMVLGQKPSSANGGTATTPASPWALDGSLTGANDGNTGGYTTTLGADTGNCNIFAYSAEATGSESGTLSVTVGTNGVCWAQMLLFRAPPGATWSVAATAGKDTSAGNLSITGAADPGVDAGDYVVAGVVIPTDVTTPSQFSAEAFSQTGVTFGTVTEFSEPDSTTGNDIGGVLFGAPVSTGPSSAAPTWTATAGGTTTNVRGPGVFVRLRATGGGGGGTDALTASDLATTPTIEAAALGQIHGLSATELSATAILDSPAIGVVHALSADNLSAEPILDAPSLGVIVAIAANDVTSVVALESAALGQVHALAANDLSTSPALDSPALGQQHALSANDVSATPALDAPPLGQVHALSASDLAVTPSLDSPAAAQVHALTGNAIESTPTLEAPAIGQTHALTGNDLASAPVLGSPALSAEGTDALEANDIAATPELGSPSVGQIHALAGSDVASAPALGSPALGLVFALSASDITASPSLTSPTLGQSHALVASDISTVPVLGSPSLETNTHALAPSDVAVVPLLGSPALGQTHALTGNGITVAIALDSPTIVDVSPIPPGRPTTTWTTPSGPSVSWATPSVPSASWSTPATSPAVTTWDLDLELQLAA